MRFLQENGKVADTVWIFVADGDPIVIPKDSCWTTPAELPDSHITFATVDGFWELVIPTDDVLSAADFTVRFPPLPATGPFGWWHRVLGITHRRLTRGAEMCIGVIDEGLHDQQDDSCIRHVMNDGGAAWGSARNPRALHPKTDHGFKICSLIASRADGSRGFTGIAPGAEVFFAAANGTSSSALWVPRVVSCIEHLTEQRGCDVISISAGDLEEASEAIENAVQDAADRGTVCFFAAGNSGRSLYPAIQKDCHGVAAIGKFDTAPLLTRIKWKADEESIPLDEPGLFVWKYSARGPEIEFCAPGVGVIFSRSGRSASALVGTSFACPLAAATAALILEKDDEYMRMDRNRARYDRAMMVLRGAAKPLGRTGVQNWKYGLLVCDE
ncbi:MAG TPA: S8 family serine peptidase [Steroidobacteraceae bacterium]|nr:S8 family serine peptidase [Steroidobacteraceae bacterium]